MAPFLLLADKILIGIDPKISPDLLDLLMPTGHGDEIAIADAAAYRMEIDSAPDEMGPVHEGVLPCRWPESPQGQRSAALSGRPFMTARQGLLRRCGAKRPALSGALYCERAWFSSRRHRITFAREGLNGSFQKSRLSLGESCERIRMFRFKLLLSAVLLLAPLGARADNLVVVELFTSQGCSSCPPADRLLAELATHDYVIPLALHVDYWDYLGWKDDFARPEFSNRQRLYAQMWHERTVYTPQMVIQGVSYMVGSRSDEIQRQIMQAGSPDAKVRLDAQNDGPDLRISLSPVGAAPVEADIHLVRYSPGESVMIERGENAGKTINYVNIVESWETLGRWDGAGPTMVRVSDVAAGQYVVIIQAPGPGEIYAAALLGK